MIQEKDLDYEYNTQALNDHGMMALMGPIDVDSVKPVIEWILHENFVKKKKQNRELLLIICSEGGSLSAAFALIDVMRSSQIPIKTVGLGEIASAGLLIFLAGYRGRRILTPNTSIMSHQFSWETQGKVHELFATVKEYDLTQQRMLKLYQESTGLDLDTIKKVLLPPQDVYLTAEEAMEYGICDQIATLNR